MRPGFGFEKLGGDAHAVSRFANAPPDVAHAEFASHLPHVNGFALVDEARISGYYEQPFDPRQSGDDVFHIPSAKYSCSGSPLIFWNANTAIEGFSGRANRADGFALQAPLGARA